MKSRGKNFIWTTSPGFILLLCFCAGSSYSSESLGIKTPCHSILRKNVSGNNCLCLSNSHGRFYGTWRIGCGLERFPLRFKPLHAHRIGGRDQIIVEVLRTGNGNNVSAMSVRILCNYQPNGKFSWDFLKGINLGRYEKVISSLEFRWCPLMTQREIKNLPENLQITSGNIKTLIFSSPSSQANLTNIQLMVQNFPNLEIFVVRLHGLQEIPEMDANLRAEVLDFRNNNIHSVRSLTNNKNLEYLFLGKNKIENLKPESFPQSLIALDLSDNRISYLDSEIFKGLSRLKLLHLSNNPLNLLPSNVFQHMPNLKSLNLDVTQIQSLPSLRYLKNLQNFSMSHSTALEIDSYEENIFRPRKNHGRNFYIPAASQKRQVAWAQSSSEAKLGLINFLPNLNSLDGLKNLKKLILNNDGITSLSFWPKYLPNLRIVQLAENKISKLPKYFFKSIPHVQAVDLSQNVIEHIEWNIDGSQLLSLDLSNNNLKKIDEKTFDGAAKLKTLQLESNQIATIHPNAFRNLVALRHVDLSHNFLTFISPPLKLYHGINNIVDRSPLWHCKSLESLILKNNRILEIWPDWVHHLKNLRHLDLSSNYISGLHPADVYFMSNHVQLDLRNNRISEVDLEMADLLFDMRERKKILILLHGNPFACNCRLSSLLNFRSHTHKFIFKQAMCHTPAWLMGKKISQVAGDELTCNLKEDCPHKCSCIQTYNTTITIDCRDIRNFEKYTKELYRFLQERSHFDFKIHISSSLNDALLTALFDNLPQDISVKLWDLRNNSLTGAPSFLVQEQDQRYNPSILLEGNLIQCNMSCSLINNWRNLSHKVIDFKTIRCHNLYKKLSQHVRELGCRDVHSKAESGKGSLNDTMKLAVVILLVGVLLPLSIIGAVCANFDFKDSVLIKLCCRIRSSTAPPQPRFFLPSKQANSFIYCDSSSERSVARAVWADERRFY